MARSMAPLYDGHDYYKRMFELQEKLRKSEEERIRLEERFNVLMRESHNRHDVCINRLRMRYIQYLEDQRTRDERNHKLLAALDRVVNKLALISAKKDRLNVLRKQYEAYLLRAYTNNRPPGSITGDSGIASQNEDKYTKKTVTMAYPDLASAETRNISSSRVHPGAFGPQSSQPRSTSKFHDQTIIDASLNNPSILTAAPLSATLNVDHCQANVLHGPHIYSAVPNAHQYPRMIPSNYDGSAPRNLQHVPDIRISYTEAPVSSMVPSDNMQPHAVPANRFFREHVESVQVASGLSETTRFPTGDTTRYEETSRNAPVPRHFDPLTLLQYHDANVLLSDPQSRIREYDPSDTAVVGPTLVTGKSSTYRTGSVMNVTNQIDPLPGYMDYILPNSQKSDDEGSTRSITSDDLDGLIRRNERLLWGNADVAKTPQSPTALGMDNSNLEENGGTEILEKELDRYINNIRKLHREHGAQSLDEMDHEQNTSGDLLNVSLSEDALELPAEERARKERVPEEMSKILALASDLASRTANLKDISRDSVRQNGSTFTEVEDKIRHREIAKSDALEFKGKCETEGRTRNEIREDVATHLAELDQPREDAQIAKENWNNTADSAKLQERDREISTTKRGSANEKIATSDGSQIDDSRSVSNEKRLDLITGKESDIEGLFDIVEELAPWDLASVQKKVHELHLDDPGGDQAAGKNTMDEDTMDEVGKNIASDSSRFVEENGVDGEVENVRSPQEMLPHSEMETEKLDTSEASKIEGQNEIRELIEDTQNVLSKVSSQHTVDEPKVASQPGKELGESDESDRRKPDNDETAEPRVTDQFEGVVKDSDYSVEQGYIEDPSQAQQYEQQEPNQQYYDPNMPYQTGNEEYRGYADQGYAQDGQEYVEYVAGQYEQYSEDLNNQQYQHYPDAQYEQDPNQAYDYSYDPNQGYGDPNQQYNPNQGYENNPNDPNDNEGYDYTEQVPYDPNQIYDSTYEQEYKEEQCNPDDDAEGRAEKPEVEEVSQKQADSESKHKTNRDEDKLQQVDVKETNQSMKKKDVIKSLLDSDTDTTIERNISNTESDFDFN